MWFRAACTLAGLVSLLLAMPSQGAVHQQLPAAPAPCAAGAAMADLLSQSQAFYDGNDAARGLPLLQQAFALSAGPGCAVFRGEALRRLALADAYVQRFDAARVKLEEAVVLLREAGNVWGESQALLQLGLVLIRSNRQADAVAPLFRARDLVVSLGDAAGTRTVYDRILYAMKSGPEKETLRSEALALARSAPEGRALECSILHEWGDELFNDGRYNESLTRLQLAVTCFDEIHDPRLGRAYVSLGRFYRAHGRLDAALQQYQRALVLQEQARDREATIQTLNAIAATYSYMGREVEALARFQDALALARAIPSRPYVQLLLGAVGSTYVSLGRYQEGVDTLEALLADPEPAQAGIRLASLSSAYLGLGVPDRALVAADRALALATGASGSATDRLNALDARSRALTALARYDEAARDQQLAVTIIERLRAETVADDFLKRGFGEVYQQVFAATIATLAAQGRDVDAMETAERARARAFLDLLAARPSRVDRGGGAGPAIRTSGAATVTEIVATARRLGSTVLTFWVDAAATTVWIVRADGRVTARTIDVTAERLAGLIADATGSGAQGPSGLVLSPAAAGRPWRRLYQVLIDPIREALPAAGSRLTIVPHGPLFTLPFAALRDARGRYLVESYDLHYVPAVGVLGFTAPAHAPTRVNALLVGDPGPGAAADEALNLPPIPWAAREVRTIARLLPTPATVLLGDTATERQVRDNLAGRTLLHFATHGIVHNEERLTSYLALRASADGPDGRLTADETYDLTLDADLVVLSGCRTALGPISGEGVIGFTRAFLAAGASSVIATMWDVPDRTSFEIMHGFYRRWLAGQPKSRSLRQAQLSLLRALREGRITVNGRPLPESPLLWAGFALVGEP